MVGVEITDLVPATRNDKGTTLEWRRPNKAASQITVYQRHNQQNFGGHYHRGQDPSKNPEILLLLAGRLKLTVENLAGDREEIVVEENQQIVIQSNIAHWLEALTGRVTILEWRLTPFNPQQSDTYPADSWPDYQKAHQPQ